MEQLPGGDAGAAFAAYNAEALRAGVWTAAGRADALRPGAPLTALVLDPRFLLHVTGSNFLTARYERPQRVWAINARLRASGLLSRCLVMPARAATPAELRAVHSEEYLAKLAATAGGPAPGEREPFALAHSLLVGSERELYAWCERENPSVRLEGQYLRRARTPASDSQIAPNS